MLPQVVGHKLALTMTLLWVILGVGGIEAEAVMLGQPISMVGGRSRLVVVTDRTRYVAT